MFSKKTHSDIFTFKYKTLDLQCAIGEANNILGWKHLMTFALSAKYYTVHHSPSFAIPPIFLYYMTPQKWECPPSPGSMHIVKLQLVGLL